MKRRVLAVVLVFGLVSFAQAGTLTVGDHSLSDWDITVADGGSVFATVGSSGIGLVGWDEDDTDDSAGLGFYLDPLYGGQEYDAEFLAVANQGGKIFIALVSGQRPDNGSSHYAPGDIRIETTAHRYGIEIGGGPAISGGTGIEEGADGAFYTLNSSGYTTGYAAGVFDAGTLIEDATFWNDPINPYFPVQVGQVLAGTNLGLTDFYFSLNSFTTTHSFVELSFDASLLDGDLKSIHWRPSCGNDELDIVLDEPFRPQSVPLPRGAVLGLAGLGFVGLLGYRRRSRLRREPV